MKASLREKIEDSKLLLVELFFVLMMQNVTTSVGTELLDVKMIYN